MTVRKNSWKLTGHWCDHVTIGFGIKIYALFCRQSASPLAFVWGLPYAAGNGKKSRFEVLGSYTIAAARRLGLRTELNRAIHRDYDVITTQHGSRDGGLAFLRASGYALDRGTGIWSLPAKRSTGNRRA